MRYLVFMMGMSSAYCGFIYNEFFAIPMSIFTSCYNLQERVKYQYAGDLNGVPSGLNNYYYNRVSDRCTYAMGVDPVWGLSTQGLSLNNNIKMKLSVIFGVAHMTIGVIIKGTNLIYRQHYPHFIFEVVTGLIILLGLFGWMDVLIFGKWFFTAGGRHFHPTKITQADTFLVPDSNPPQYMFYHDRDNQKSPSVINIMINTVF